MAYALVEQQEAPQALCRDESAVKSNGMTNLQPRNPRKAMKVIGLALYLLNSCCHKLL
jgi:hypothetical protein